MRRYYIVEGDETSVGGIVQRHTGSAQTTTVNDKIVSNIGDKINCSACGSVGTIEAVGYRQPFGNHSNIPAMENDICICKCSPSPILKHSQELFYQDVEYGIDITDVLQQVSSIGENTSKRYNLKFQNKNSLGQPITNTSYMIVDEDGETYFGITDSQGYTSDIFSNLEKKFSVHILLDDTEGGEND